MIDILGLINYHLKKKKLIGLMTNKLKLTFFSDYIEKQKKKKKW